MPQLEKTTTKTPAPSVTSAARRDAAKASAHASKPSSAPAPVQRTSKADTTSTKQAKDAAAVVSIRQLEHAAEAKQPAANAKAGADKVTKDAKPNYAGNWVDAAKQAKRPVVVAHRGEVADAAKNERHAGNDMDSLELAAAGTKSDVVESDTRQLGDGTIVMFHDAVTERDKTSRAGTEILELQDLSLAEFRALHPDAPTLEEWSKRAGDLDVDVLIDFKGEGYEAQALEILQRNIDAEHVAIAAFSTDVLRIFHELDADVPLGLFADRPNADGTVTSSAQQIQDLGFVPDFVEITEVNDTAANLATYATYDIPVMYAGVDAAVDAARQGVDVMGIMTNTPSDADARLDRLHGEDDQVYMAPGAPGTDYSGGGGLA
ncbi:MAG: glycerophosphodiester phosphodiesterase [Thermoleophilia bacterium]|nr:glycerophosphodiester phosphodiesterase [Thermoleophilia bacterium]